MALAADPAPAQQANLEVLHDWTSSGEKKALEVIAKSFEQAGGRWIDAAITGNRTEVTTSRVVGGDPPGAAKFTVGKHMDELADAGLLADADAVAVSENWEKELPGFIWTAVQRNGHVLAVPINLQADTWIWYSKEVFKKSGAAVPETFDELFIALDKIKAAGYIPLAMGGAQTWQYRHLFNKVLIGVGGPELYRQLYSDSYASALKSDKFKQVGDAFGRLRNYVDPGTPNRDWNVATNLVIANRAGLQVMGDWAKGEFAAAGLKPGIDYGCLLGPGPKSVALSGDVFILPKRASQREGQLKLARVMLSNDVQIAFSRQKGSMPVRLDTDVSSLDVCTQEAMKVIQDPEAQLPAAGFLLSNDRRTAVESALGVFFSSRTATTKDLISGLQSAFGSTN